MKLLGDLFGIVGTETIQIDSGNFYCLLVLEIDLSKESTKETFNQVSFKILTSSTAYPSVTQQDINKINVSNKLYQLEFARFKTSASGITDFQDKRTFLDFNSIYTQIQNEYKTVLEELQQELANVKDGSDYLLKSVGGVVQGLITANGGIKGNLTGNADSSTKLKTARSIKLEGSVSGSANFDGSKDTVINVDLNSQQLTSQDLNTITTEGFYYAYGGNTVKNKPTRS